MSDQSTPDERTRQLNRLTKAQLVALLLDAQDKKQEAEDMLSRPEEEAEDLIQRYNDHVLVVRVMAILWSYLFRIKHSSAKALQDRTFRLNMEAALRDAAAVSYRERSALREAMGEGEAGAKAYRDLTHSMNFEGWEQAVAQAQEEGLAKTAQDLIAEA